MKVPGKNIGILRTTQSTIVLVGLESVGKSALFRALTGEATADETNFRGSTVRVRSAPLSDSVNRCHEGLEKVPRTLARRLIDTPGIRVQDDSVTTQLALEEMQAADTVVLVARGTHIQQEINALLTSLGKHLANRNVALVTTFEDKASSKLDALMREVETDYDIPVALVNARQMSADQRARLLTAIDHAAPLKLDPDQHQSIMLLPDPPVILPEQTLFERRRVGAWLSLATLMLIFAIPVYLAYIFADWVQPFVDGWLITPLIEFLAPVAMQAPLLFVILVGNYGLLTLGWYSFLWAFPVVLLIGISVALIEESGLKDRMTDALDSWFRHIGLNGRDLIPILSGFGCNVVAVFQSRACSRCTHNACVSLIAFGSACSYQIGASLSLFNSAGAPWLFGPYLLLLFFVGAIYTRLWHGDLEYTSALPLAERSFLQRPTLNAIRWRVHAVVRQFVREAMPIFLLICVMGALLEFFGLIAWLSACVTPLLSLLGLPGEVAPGVIFSIIRKDGLLILNQNNGALLQSMSSSQVFVLIYFASTLTACLVTLWTIGQELGWRYASLLAGRQALTSLLSTGALVGLLLL
ncbi:50S ribosome-binding GTPase [Chloroflexi bacterium TSY]|nr:50S ribosome-binding GTPase [Chloroflexi bacterium TSY]